MIAALLLLWAPLALVPAALAQDSPAQDAPAQAPAELPPITVPPSLVDFAEAEYPAAAAEQGVTGTVMLLISIDATGAVTQVQVDSEPQRAETLGAETLGAEILGAETPEGTPATWGFGEAAAAAARLWRFSPAQDASGPVPVAIQFAYDFTAPPPPPAPEAAGASPAQVEGQLVEMGTRRPLDGFPVVLTDSQGARVELSTDAEGRFAGTNLAPGPVAISATYPGYDRVDKQVTAPALVDGVLDGSPATVRLWLRNLSYRDDEIVGVYRLPVEDVTKQTISTEEVRRIPGTFGDPIRVIQNLPGAARAPLGTGLLVIRGANPEDSAVYIDGIRVPLIYHLGGYRSVINADLVDSIDYLPGGYGVQYGRSTGGVVDVKTKREFPERRRLTWKTDVLDTSALLEGRAGKQGQLGFAVAARRSYIDALIPFFTKDSGFTIKPRWYDYQLKAQALKLPRGHLSAFVFGFQDVLRVSTPTSFAQGTDQDTQGAIGTMYGTHRAVVQWEQPLASDLSLKLVPSLGLDVAGFHLGSAFDLTQKQVLLELRSELDWKAAPAAEVTAGIDFIGGWYKFKTVFPFDPTSIASYDPLAERQPFSQVGTGWAWGPDFYLSTDLRPLADRSRLLIKPGIRTSVLNIVHQLSVASVDPRLIARAEIIKGGSLKLGTGLYSQPPQPYESWRPDGDVQLQFERAWSHELGWEQQLKGGVDADVSVFYKTLDHLIVSNPDLVSFDDQFFINEGIGRVYGLEAILRKAPTGRLFGWISYTLSRSVRNDYPTRTGGAHPGLFGPFDTSLGWYNYDFDQTHILVGVAGYKLPRDFEISGKVQYVTGNPYTPYAGGVYDVDQDTYMPYSTGTYNSSRQPPFTAVDLRADKLFTFKRWQLELYIDLLNVYRGENPEFTNDNYDYTEMRYIRGLPFIPSPGFQAEFQF